MSLASTRERDTVLVRRPVRVERVPDGTPIELATGTRAQVTQALGSSFTLVVDGQLVRLPGRDADAIGREPPQAPAIPADVAVDDVRELVWQTLKTCYDPEIPVDIVELGLVSCPPLRERSEPRRRAGARRDPTDPDGAGLRHGRDPGQRGGRQGAGLAARGRGHGRHGVRPALGPLAHVRSGVADAGPVTVNGTRCAPELPCAVSASMRAFEPPAADRLMKEIS